MVNTVVLGGAALMLLLGFRETLPKDKRLPMDWLAQGRLHGAPLVGCAVSYTDAAVLQVAGKPVLLPENALQDPHNVLASPQPSSPLTSLLLANNHAASSG